MMKTLRWILMSTMILGLLIGSVGVGVVQAQEEVPPVEETEEPETPEEVEETTTIMNPVVLFLDSLLGEDYTAEDIIAFQEDGYGLGEIAKAYFLTTLLTDLQADPESEFVLPEDFDGSFESLVGLAREIGWGNVYKDLGLHPGDQRGLGWLFKEYDKQGFVKENNKPEWAGPPDHANNDKDKDKSNKK